jgi:DNA-binding response OmpR family regulator
MSAKILLVEDDPNLGFVIKDNLQLKGYEVTLRQDGQSAEDVFVQDEFDLCILDIMMPKKDGFTVARGIREKNKKVPILFVTAKTMLEDKIEGFRAGGDDYITKPFSMEELFLRIEVFLKRSASPRENIVPLGNFVFDRQNLVLKHPAGNKTLTQKESDVLTLLCRHRDRVLKREEILKEVWGDDDYFLGRSMDVFISKLRKYLREDPAVQIVNYHGVGFRLEVNA